MLESDLGGGKTTFTRGLARGAGSQDVVSSPTFTISNLYKSRLFDIYHFDFYRLDDAGIIKHELVEATNDRHNIVVIEWANIIKNVLPQNKLEIKIEHRQDNNRIINFVFTKELKYLITNIIKC